MESRFGADFSGVRVHADGRAAESAHQLAAHAYTIGSDIFFGRSQYQPSTTYGRHLLAHELTHVLQQASGRPGSSGPISEPGDVGEREAERVAHQILERRADDHLSDPRRATRQPARAMIQRAADQTARSTVPVQTRCPSHGPCHDDDPLVLYQGGGSTTCNPITGKMQSYVKENCAGDCVDRHEKQHRLDYEPCCGRYKRCLDTAGTDPARRAACEASWATWFQQATDWTQCNAYTVEFDCLHDLTSDPKVCGGPQATVSHACCGSLLTEMASAAGRMETHCAKGTAVNVPCPF